MTYAEKVAGVLVERGVDRTSARRAIASEAFFVRLCSAHVHPVACAGEVARRVGDMRFKHGATVRGVIEAPNRKRSAER